MPALEYIAPGIYGNPAKRQVHVDIPAFLQRHGIEPTAANLRRATRAALHELRCAELALAGFVLIARQKGIAQP
jgi:hypothetical protein